MCLRDFEEIAALYFNFRRSRDAEPSKNDERVAVKIPRFIYLIVKDARLFNAFCQNNAFSPN